MFTLMQLPFGFKDLEPYIDAQTVEIHYSKHHAGYVAKLNTALENYPDFQTLDLVELLKKSDILPQEIKKAVINNGGQVYNHNIYWETLGPASNNGPEKSLLTAIEENFGSFDNFKAEFEQLAASQFGSGWAWLSLDINNQKLEISNTSNQDSPLFYGKQPLMTIDVWEHAYYLKYQNRRPEYISAFWNIINWQEVSRKYEDFSN